MSVHSVIRGVMSGWYIETGDSGEPYATAESASERIIRALDTAGLLVIRGGEPEPPALPADLPQDARNAAPWPPPAPGTHEDDLPYRCACEEIDAGAEVLPGQSYGKHFGYNHAALSSVLDCGWDARPDAGEDQ